MIKTTVPIDLFRDEQKLRLDMQDKLAVADETLVVLEDLLAKVTARLKKVESENSTLKTQNAILQLGNSNQRVTPGSPFTLPKDTSRYPQWYSRDAGQTISLLGQQLEAAINGKHTSDEIANGIVWFP